MARGVDGRPRRHALRLALGVSAICTACFHPTQYADQVVWADDDSQMAVVVLKFQERRPLDPLNGTTDKRGFHHQVQLQAVDGSGVQFLGQDRAGQNGTEVYLMRTAGYLVLDRIVDGLRRVELMTLDGQEHEIASLPFTTDTCRGVHVVPSPDGQWLAQVEVMESCRDTSVVVRFRRAPSLEEPYPAQRVNLGIRAPDWTWRPAGDFVVANAELAQVLTPGQAPITTTLPGCTSPKTRSSNTASDGRMAWTSGDHIDITPAGSGTPFGCQ